jgi:hypothetical protein
MTLDIFILNQKAFGIMILGLKTLGITALGIIM